MQKLVEGIHHFQQTIFRPNQEFFSHLTRGQNPQALFITCADSRINPNLITNTEPGDLFIVRNVGNLVPPYGATSGGDEAAVEYAVYQLGIPDIIVCGHTRCGAMQGLLSPDGLTRMPRLARWLGQAEATRRIMDEVYPHLTGDARWTATAEENVLVQLENLRTHPAVAAGLAAGNLKLHGWVYKMETGAVFAYDPQRGQYLPLTGGEAEKKN
jgi:carbonic anhydrase